MPPFITGISSLNFTTTYNFESADDSEYNIITNHDLSFGSMIGWSKGSLDNSTVDYQEYNGKGSIRLIPANSYTSEGTWAAVHQIVNYNFESGKTYKLKFDVLHYTNADRNIVYGVAEVSNNAFSAWHTVYNLDVDDAVPGESTSGEISMDWTANANTTSQIMVKVNHGGTPLNQSGAVYVTNFRITDENDMVIKYDPIDFSTSTYTEPPLRSYHNSNGGSTYGKSVRCIEYLGDGVILAGTQNGISHSRIYKSTDYGSTWTISKTFNYLNHVSDIKHIGDNIVLASTGGHDHDGNVYRSTDGGDSWTLVNDWGGGRYRGHDNVYSLEYLGNGICLIAGGYNEGDGSVWRSADFGVTWTDLRGSNSGTTNTGNVAWDNSLVFDNNNTYYSDYNSVTDSWWVQSLKYVGNGVVLANRRAVRTSGGSSSTYPELIRSTDYGINWTIMPSTFMNNGLLQTENLGNGRVVGVTSGEGSTSSDNGNVYISEDYGQTWDTTSKFTLNRNRVYGLTHLGNGHVVFGTYHVDGSPYMAGGGEIYESLDYGETWNSTPVFDPNIVYILSTKFDPANSTLYVGGSVDHSSPILYKLG